jgi:hypothetical protein
MKSCLFLFNFMSPFNQKKLYGDEVFELGVTVGMVAHRLFLARCALAQFEFSQ